MEAVEVRLNQEFEYQIESGFIIATVASAVISGFLLPFVNFILYLLLHNMGIITSCVCD